MSVKPISLVILAVICVVAGRIEKAHSATRFAGAYFGSFSTSCGAGSFALLAYPDGRLIILAEQATGEDASAVDHRANEVVNPDGSFRISGFLGRNSTIVALFEPGKVEGEILGPDCPGVVSGTKEPAEGFFMELGGYYTGSTEGTVTIVLCLDPVFLPFCAPDRFVSELLATYRGNLFSIMRADGFSYLLFERTEFTIVNPTIVFSIPEPESEADIIRIQLFDGKYRIDCPNSFRVECQFGTRGGFVTGVLNAQFFFLGGILAPAEGFFFGGLEGPYQLTRAAPLPNNPPTGVSDAYTFVGPLRRTVDADHGVLANDTDAEGDALTAVLDTGPAHGELTLRADGSFDYTPNRGFTGTDVFIYLANDGFSESAPVAVTVTVEPVKAMPWLQLLLLED